MKQLSMMRAPLGCVTRRGLWPACVLGMVLVIGRQAGAATSPGTVHARTKEVSAKRSPDAAHHVHRSAVQTEASHASASSTSPRAPHHRVARVPPPVPSPPCLAHPVDFERGFGGEVQSVVLTRCDGRPAPRAIEQVSVLVRPMTAPKPPLEATAVGRGAPLYKEWLPGVKLVDEGLIQRLQRVVDHFKVSRVTVVSGYRPTSLGSFHQSARAIDFHLNGVSNEALVAFCRTLRDTGCGYYPNSSFIHMDVRAPGTGHVYWIDASGPGEAARYVATWPPKDGVARLTEIPRPDPAAPLDEQTHPDSPQPPLDFGDSKGNAERAAPLNRGDGKDDPFRP